MKNKNLLSTLIYIYIIILTFIVLYYIYNDNVDMFETSDTYNSVVNNNIPIIKKYINDNFEKQLLNKRINDANKQKINELMEKSITKINTIIDNYILNI